MIERAVRFGRQENLLGIVSEPNDSSPRQKDVAVLWLNAGILHHVGPFGWYVTLARRLAGHGILNFRFDLAGIGDSLPGPGTGSPLDRGLADLTEAMDFLAAKRQAQRFVVIGLCSGAVLAHHIAIRDERIVGAVFFDGIGYKTAGFYLRHFGRRLGRWQSWLTLARRLTRLGKRQPSPPSLLSEVFFFDFPTRAQAQSDLSGLLRQGKNLLFFYTGGLDDQYFNHRKQFEEMFGRLEAKPGQLHVEYAPQADHIYSAYEQRQAMFKIVENWLLGFI